MPRDKELREERFRLDADYHQAPNQLIDRWGRHIVEGFGTSHAWMLTVVYRLTLGFGYRARRLPISRVVTLTGLGRGRAYEVLADLEATGVFAIRNRGRGRVPLIVIDLDWEPTGEAIECGLRVKRARLERKTSGERDEVFTTADNLDSGELSTRDYNPVVHHSEQLELSAAVNNQLSATVNNKKETERKAPQGDDLPKASRRVSAGTNSVGERTPTPPQPSSSSSSGEKTTTDDDDYDPYPLERVDPRLGPQDRLLVARFETACKEGAVSDWRTLRSFSRGLSDASFGILSDVYVEKYAERLELRSKRHELQQVVELTLRAHTDESFSYLVALGERCALENEEGRVEHPWPFFLSAVVGETDDTLLYVDPETEQRKREELWRTYGLLEADPMFDEELEALEATSGQTS